MLKQDKNEHVNENANENTNDTLSIEHKHGHSLKQELKDPSALYDHSNNNNNNINHNNTHINCAECMTYFMMRIDLT